MNDTGRLSVVPDPPDEATELEETVRVVATRHPGVDVVAISGDFDVSSVREVKRVVFDARVCAQTEVVLDLSGVRFMDSMGVSTVFACRKQVTARAAHLSLVCPPGGRTAKLLAGLGMDVVLTIYPSVDDALEALAVSS